MKKAVVAHVSSLPLTPTPPRPKQRWKAEKWPPTPVIQPWFLSRDNLMGLFCPITDDLLLQSRKHILARAHSGQGCVGSPGNAPSSRVVLCVLSGHPFLLSACICFRELTLPSFKLNLRCLITWGRNLVSAISQPLPWWIGFVSLWAVVL